MSAHTHEFVSTRRIGEATVSLVREMSGPSAIALNVAEAIWREEVPETAVAERVPFSMTSAVIQAGGDVIVIDPLIDDLDAMIVSRRDLLPRFGVEQALATFSHAAFPGRGRIMRHGDWVQWEPLG